MDIGNKLAKLTTEQKVRLCIDPSSLRISGIPEEGIPGMRMTDGTSGLRILDVPDPDPKQAVFEQAINSSFDTEDALAITHPATCFPAGSSLACSFDTDLAQEIGAAVAEECKSVDVGLLFGPGLNTRRSPLDGRGFEYYSEDPVLAGDMAAGMVKGLQDNEVGACVKHFVCNNSNYLRTITDNIVEERALREIYLAAFERVIKKAKPSSVMASYNLLNGVQAAENKWLLTDVLRDEWGFDGVVMSDCGAIKDYLKAYKAGIDYEMPHTKIGADKYIAAVESGEISEEELDMHAGRILSLIDRYSRQGKEAPQVDFEKHHALARKAAAKCAVLLKNEGKVLPLSGDARVAVMGSWAKSPVFQGTGCAIVKAKTVDIPLDEIRALCPGAVYVTGYSDPAIPREEELCEAERAAKDADAVIVFAGALLPPETDDYNRKNMDIEPAQEALIRRVSAVNKNVIVVLSNCESVVMPWIDHVPAVLDFWYSGEGFGHAAAQLLFGCANPEGRLAVTMPRRLEDCPDYLHFPGENHRQLYGEGVFVGYRYYDKKKVEPLFPFGHGLSYTEFAYSDLKVTGSIASGGSVKVSVTVKNTGNMAGSETVQIYVRDEHSRLMRPVRELKAFRKVFLQPGESRLAEFELDRRAFAFYDPARKDWTVDNGDFIIEAAASSRDIRLTVTVRIEEEKEYRPVYAPDSHYIEIYQDPRAKKILLDTYVEWGLISREALTPEAETKICNSFWGIAQHLDLLVPYQVTEEMVMELVRRLNG